MAPLAAAARPLAASRPAPPALSPFLALPMSQPAEPLSMTDTPIPSGSSPQGPAEPDLSGRRIGDYQLLRRLGRGGMAEVYLAEQLSLQRQVALKVLRSNLALDAAYVRRFHNEGQAAPQLVHAQIVQIHEGGCIDGAHFLAQGYVAGP